MVKLNTQEIAAILVEELQKVKEYIQELKNVEAHLREDLSKAEQINKAHLAKLESLTLRKMEFNTTYLDQKFKDKLTMPRWFVYLLLAETFFIGAMLAYFIF